MHHRGSTCVITQPFYVVFSSLRYCKCCLYCLYSSHMRAWDARKPVLSFRLAQEAQVAQASKYAFPYVRVEAYNKLKSSTGNTEIPGTL